MLDDAEVFYGLLKAVLVEWEYISVAELLIVARVAVSEHVSYHVIVCFESVITIVSFSLSLVHLLRLLLSCLSRYLLSGVRLIVHWALKI